MRMRRLCLKTSEAAGHNLLIRGGLQAYALTISLLGFECTRYEIKSRDMNEKEKDFIYITNHICLQHAVMVHCTWCVHSVPAPCSHPITRSACTHTVALPAAAWPEGWRGAYTKIYSSYSL